MRPWRKESPIDGRVLLGALLAPTLPDADAEEIEAREAIRQTLARSVWGLRGVSVRSAIDEVGAGAARVWAEPLELRATALAGTKTIRAVLVPPAA